MPLVDRLLDQRVRDLVAQLPAVLGLVDEAPPHELVERLGGLVERLAAERDDVGEFIRYPTTASSSSSERPADRALERAR